MRGLTGASSWSDDDAIGSRSRSDRADCYRSPHAFEAKIDLSVEEAIGDVARMAQKAS
jgi:hypothetical protein